jgi:transcriptional regulator with XRE-family HTH domain
MAKINTLLQTPPYAVEAALKTVGRNLRTARVRRKLSIQELADKIGVSRYRIAEAEKGKASTSIGVYVGLLWALGLIDQFGRLADPKTDDEGSTLARAREKVRARHSRVLNNDF